jgi:ankyrin repeat protein
MVDASNALGDALRNADVEAARAILRNQPDALNTRQSSEPSLLMQAIYMRNAEFVSLLLEHGLICSVWEAAALGDTLRLEAAIKHHGGATTTTSPDGWTPLHLAAHFGKPEACARLIEAGADVNAWSENDLRNQPLHAAIAGGNTEVVDLLLRGGADVNAVQHGGFTPLHGAAQNGSEAIVEALLTRGADVRATTDDGQDAAALAATHGFTAIAGRLRSQLDRIG